MGMMEGVIDEEVVENKDHAVNGGRGRVSE